MDNVKRGSARSRGRHRTFLLSLALLAFTGPVVDAANGTVCATDQLDWYTSVIGESPCRTYERLRQICDQNYAVGAYDPNTPLNVCNSQQTSCCCNSIAWNLAMLCLNCQASGSTASQPDGFDAPNGTYGVYLNNCSPVSNGSLPANIQLDVCATQIDLRPTLYDAMWMDTGAWFYTYFHDTMHSDLLGETGKNLTNCPAKPSPSASSSPAHSSTTSTTSSSSSSTPAPAPSKSGPNVAAIAGGVAGGVAVLLCALLVGGLWWRRRVHRQYAGDEIVPAGRQSPTPVLEPFPIGENGEPAPPPYIEAPRGKAGALLAAQFAARPAPDRPSGDFCASAYGASSSGAGLGTSSATRTSSQAGEQTEPTPQSAWRRNEKASVQRSDA